MPVTVRFFAAARQAAGAPQTTCTPGTLQSLSRELTERFPKLEPVLPRCSYLVNGIAVHGDAGAVTIQDGDEVDILPPFAGG